MIPRPPWVAISACAAATAGILLASTLDKAAAEGCTSERPMREVIDGDTFCLGGRPTRLFGIDAPEAGQPFGFESALLLSELLSHGATFCITQYRDRFGRVVAKCSNEHLGDVAARLVDLGAAWDWPAYSGGAYAPLEERARAERRGLWAAQAPMPPWQWRNPRHRELAPK